MIAFGPKAFSGEIRSTASMEIYKVHQQYEEQVNDLRIEFAQKIWLAYSHYARDIDDNPTDLSCIIAEKNLSKEIDFLLSDYDSILF